MKGGIHAKVFVDGKIGRLKNHYLHTPYLDSSQQIKTIDRYSQAYAEDLYNSNHRFYLINMILRPVYRFFRDYIFKLGFLDGIPGLIIVASTMYYVFMKHAKLWELEKRNGKKEIFKEKEVLVTGGLGFIGSNLCIELVKLGAHVTIVDNMLPRQGGNLFNIKDIEDKVRVNFSDVRNSLSMNHLVKGKDYVFHLAGQVNHVDSMRNPIQDLEINCRGTLVLLEALRHYNRSARVIFAGTRGEYGSSVKLPVDEDHPTNPKGIYAVTNLTAEKMVLVYHDIFGIKGCV